MAGSPFKMADLSRGKESLGAKPGKITSSPYSYEHRIALDAGTLGKLGIDTPQVGDKYHVLGHAEVTSVSSNHDSEGGKSTRAELQFKKLGLKKKGSPGAVDAVTSGINEANTNGN